MAPVRPLGKRNGPKRQPNENPRQLATGRLVLPFVAFLPVPHGRWPASARRHFAETLSRFISRQSWYALSGDPSASLEQNLRTSGRQAACCSGVPVSAIASEGTKANARASRALRNTMARSPWLRQPQAVESGGGVRGLPIRIG